MSVCETSVEHAAAQVTASAAGEADPSGSVDFMARRRAEAYEFARSLRGPYTPQPRTSRTGVAVECGCPDCGGTLVPVAIGRPDVSYTTGMFRCDRCACRVQVQVALTVTHRPGFRTPGGAGLTPRKSRAKAAA